MAEVSENPSVACDALLFWAALLQPAVEAASGMKVRNHAALMSTFDASCMEPHVILTFITLHHDLFLTSLMKPKSKSTTTSSWPQRYSTIITSLF